MVAQRSWQHQGAVRGSRLSVTPADSARGRVPETRARLPTGVSGSSPGAPIADTRPSNLKLCYDCAHLFPPAVHRAVIAVPLQRLITCLADGSFQRLYGLFLWCL